MESSKQPQTKATVSSQAEAQAEPKVMVFGKLIPKSSLKKSGSVVAVRSHVGNENEIPLNEVSAFVIQFGAFLSMFISYTDALLGR